MVVSPTRSLPNASKTGEVGSPARRLASAPPGTPSSTHSGSETQLRSLSGFAGSGPVYPSSGVPGTPAEGGSSDGSTDSTPSSCDMRVIDSY